MRPRSDTNPATLLVAAACAAAVGPALASEDDPGAVEPGAEQAGEPPVDSTAKADPGEQEDADDEYEREEKQAAQVGVAGFFQRSADNITSQLKTQWLRFGGFVQTDPVSRLGEEWRSFNEDLSYTSRLDLGLAYTALWQHSTFSTGSRSAAAGDFDFFGTWHLVGEEGRDAGLVGFATEARHDFGGDAPSELGRNIGSILGTTNGFNTFDFTLRQIWWQQLAAGGRVLARVGKIQLSDFFNTGRFRSANFFFLNRAFTGNLTVPFPGAGPGAVLFGFPSESFYLAGGIATADANEASSGFSGLAEGELFHAAEFGVLTALDGLGPGTFRFTIWSIDAISDSGAPSGEGFALSFDQQLGAFVPFLRYAYNNRPGLTEVRQVVSGGFGWENPFGNEGDLFGLGLAWAHPDAPGARDEYVVEAFYRIQLTPTLQFTPDVQVIIHPAFGTEDAVGVLGLRFRIQY